MYDDDMPNEYLNANDEFSKACSALMIARRKQSRVNAWEWANVAARHAERIGIGNARDLLGTKPFPDLSALDAALVSLRKSELLIVTRHKGLIEWLNRRGYHGRVISRATPADILNKHVIGKLPIHLAAIAASLTSVNIPSLPENRWGEELSADEMEKMGAFMRTYTVKEITVIEAV